ncbi:MAG: hypothetical protein F9B45_19400 [Phycisphaera sp. RhM]|nr:hypothetical protein [Phycisphaera sp. RhM]
MKSAAALSFDAFDTDSGIDETMTGVTYTDAPSAIPEPTARVLLGMAGCVNRFKTTAPSQAVDGVGSRAPHLCCSTAAQLKSDGAILVSFPITSAKFLRLSA